MRLFVGDDWAQGHHDVEVMDEAGKVLARKRLPEGAAGMTQLHGLVGGFLGEDADGPRWWGSRLTADRGSRRWPLRVTWCSR